MPSTNSKPGFDNAPIGNMVAVGAVHPSRFRLWIRTEAPGRVTVAWRPAGKAAAFERRIVAITPDNPRDNALGVTIGDSEAPLVPTTRYDYRVVSDREGQIIGEGTVETAPAGAADTPDRFSLAVMSCNQPFDKYGRTKADAEQMLRATYRSFKAHNTKMVLMIGDQMYADMPRRLSLFNPDYLRQIHPRGEGRLQACSAEEIRRLYQQRYRHFWNLPAWHAIHREFPCYMIWDDHDIVDNWGSALFHQEAGWRRVLEGARGAFMDYQGSLVFDDEKPLPEAFDFGIRYGTAAVWVMDIRSKRRVGPGARIYAPEQERRLAAFLDRHQDAETLFIVLPVPVIHLPRAIARLGARLLPEQEDFSDRWSSRGHVRDRDRLLERLYRHQRDHPRQCVVLLSGDIHMGCVHRVRFPEAALLQVISSGITHGSGPLVQAASQLLIRANRKVQTADGALRGRLELMKADGPDRNPFTGLNVGIVEMIREGPASPTRRRIYLYSHDNDRPMCVYRSPLL